MADTTTPNNITNNAKKKKKRRRRRTRRSIRRRRRRRRRGGGGGDEEEEEKKKKKTNSETEKDWAVSNFTVFPAPCPPLTNQRKMPGMAPRLVSRHVQNKWSAASGVPAKKERDTERRGNCNSVILRNII